MITSILFIVFTIAVLFLWITGVKVTMQENMIFEGLDEVFNDKDEDWYTPTKKILYYICKPIFICHACMCSVHGLFITFLMSMLFNLDFNIVYYIVVPVCSLPIVYYYTPKILYR